MREYCLVEGDFLTEPERQNSGKWTLNTTCVIRHDAPSAVDSLKLSFLQSRPPGRCGCTLTESLSPPRPFLNAHAVCRPPGNGAYAAMSTLCRLIQRGLLSGRPSCRLFPGQQHVRTASSSRYFPLASPG